MGLKANRRLGSTADVAFGASGIADMSAPTVAEITSLTRIECDIVGSGTIDTARTGSSARIEGLCEMESAEIAAFITNSPVSMQMYRHFEDGVAASDDVYVLMDDTANPPTTQHLVICRGGFSGALGVAVATDIVDVYEGQVSERNPIGPQQSSAQMFDVKLTVLSVQHHVSIAA